MLRAIVIPNAEPVTPVPGYHMNQDSESLVGWDFVAREMSAARFYWVSTVSPSGQPHVAPVWGLWFGDRFHFDGTPQTKWGRNLAANPGITVHLPDGERVVIIEGVAKMLADDELNDDEWSVLDSAYHEKYATDQGSPFRYVEPTKVLAWDGEDLQTMTRWIFRA